MSFIRPKTVSVLQTTWLLSFLVPFSMYGTVKGKTRATAVIHTGLYLYMSREIKPLTLDGEVRPVPFRVPADQGFGWAKSHSESDGGKILAMEICPITLLSYRDTRLCQPGG